MLKSFFRLITGRSKSHSKIDQLRYLSQSALIEETSAPYAVRTTLFMISLVVISLFVWAGFTQVNEIAVTEGEVIPSKHVQAISILKVELFRKLKL